MTNLFHRDSFLQQDFFSFFCRGLIDKGKDREVYEFAFDEKYVVKIDVGNNFANVTEFKVWSDIVKERKEIAKYFAPCHSISPCGRILLQERTWPISGKAEIKIPSFCWDMQKKNFGYLGDRIVIHDYAQHVLYKNLNADIQIKFIE